MNEQALKGKIQAVGCLGIIVIAIIAVIGGFGRKSATPDDPNKDAIIDARYGAETQVERQLRDPSSAEFTDVAVYVHPRGGFVSCGYVNSRNAFGGMAGPRRFVGNNSFAAIAEGENATAVDMAWNELCVTRTTYQP